MKSAFAIALLLVATPAPAQQKTAGDAFSEGFMRGRQIRQAAEERKALAEKRENERTATEFNAAYNTPWLVLKSRNDLPDITLSEKSVSLCGKNFAAFTRDAKNELVYGCASLVGEQLKVNWVGYGERTYDPSEWQESARVDADHAPLGSQ